MKRTLNILSVVVPVSVVLLLGVARHQQGVRSPIEPFLIEFAPYASAGLISSALIVADVKRRGNSNA